MSRSYIDQPCPIAALATKQGIGALAIIRITGPNIFPLFAPLFSQPKKLLAAQGHSLIHGHCVDPASGEKIDEVLISKFCAPKSFTGEDQLEISCHGSPLIVQKIMSTLERAGFAPALPGEFSLRAFINGKIDLLAAEAINELITANSDRARQSALSQLEGNLSKRIAFMREKLLLQMAEVELRLDYGDDEIETEFDIAPLLTVQEEIASLAQSYTIGKLYHDGVELVLVGRVNAGKSSLFNLLLKTDRSIVSAEAGTTRDYIEADIEIDGFALRIVDTAGFRFNHDLDDELGAIEQRGIERTHERIAHAQILIYLIDATRGLNDEDRQFIALYPEAILVWNKIDSAENTHIPHELHNVIPFSSKLGFGLEQLQNAISASIKKIEQSASENKNIENYAFTERQKVLFERALISLGDAIYEHTTAKSGNLDMAATALLEVADSLGEISGEITRPEILETLFTKFCVGK